MKICRISGFNLCQGQENEVEGRMKKCLGNSHLDFLITKESCSLEEGGSRVCWEATRVGSDRTHRAAETQQLSELGTPGVTTAPLLCVAASPL